MTKREQEILGYIKDNPFVSQAEIAEKANITRSSVAVHITNLMKKGLLQGRAYVLSNNSYVVAIGAANIEILGIPEKKLSRNGNNDGLVRQTVGGICRNISENLKRLDIDVELISAFSDDHYGNLLMDSCKNFNISISSSLFVPNNKSGISVCVAEETEESHYMVTDTSIYERITPDYIMSRADVIRGAKAIVVDANLRQDTIEYIASAFSAPIFVDPVSVEKCKKLENVLGKIYAIKPNKAEAEVLTGMEIKKYKDLRLAASTLLDKGVKQLFISLGSGGVFYASEQSCGRVPSIVDTVINASGAGDAFLAGVVYAHLNRFNIKHAAQIGSAASKISLSSPETVNKDMSGDLVNSVLIKAF